MNRTSRIYVRCSSEEKSQISNQAKEHGYAASRFMRECGMNGKVEPVPSINYQQWARLAGLSSNLNQLLYHINTGRIPETLRPTVEALQTVLFEVRAALIKEAP
jgi:hypothetical protein